MSSPAAVEPAPADRRTPRFDIRITVRICRSLRRDDAREETVIADNVGLGGARISTLLPLVVDEVVEVREVCGPFRTAARVRTVSIEEQVHRAHLVFLASAGVIRKWLVRARVLPPPGRNLEIDMPFGDGRRKAAICTTIADAFSGVPGDWRVAITSVNGFSPPWWLVTVDGKYERFSLSFRSSEQAPEVVHERLVEQLRRRNLVD